MSGEPDIERGGELEDRTVQHGPVTVRKIPERKPNGIVVRYLLDSSAGAAAAIELTDELPPARSEVGFHAEKEPKSWETEGDTISIGHTLDPGGTSVLALGVVLGDGASTGFDPSKEPDVRDVRLLDADDGGPENEGHGRDEDGEDGLLDRARGVLFETDEPAAADEAGPPEPTEPREDSEAEPDTTDRRTDGTYEDGEPIETADLDEPGGESERAADPSEDGKPGRLEFDLRNHIHDRNGETEAGKRREDGTVTDGAKSEDTAENNTKTDRKRDDGDSPTTDGDEGSDSGSGETGVTSEPSQRPDGEADDGTTGGDRGEQPAESQEPVGPESNGTPDSSRERTDEMGTKDPDERSEDDTEETDKAVKSELDSPHDGDHDPAETKDPDRQEAPTDANGSETGGAPTVAPDGDLVSAFVSALQGASEKELESIRRSLDGERPRSEQVRLRHVHSRMDELTVYTDLLEGFIDDHGTPTEYADELEADLGTVRSELEDVKAELESIESGLTEIRTDQSLLRSDVTELESSLESLSSDVRGIRETPDTEVAELTAQFDRMTTRLESIETALERKAETVETVAEEFESVRTDLADVFDRERFEPIGDDRHGTASEEE